MAHVLFYHTFSGTKNNPGKPGQPGHPGYMNLLFYKVKTKTWQIVSLEESYGTEDFHLKICDTNADLKRGQINIRAGSGEVAENLALVFSVCLLHVFLQPRPANWEPGESLVPEQRFRSRGNRRVRHINAESVALIMAAGLLMATPSNHFIRKRMKDSHMAGGFARGGALGDREDNEGEGVQVVTQDASDSVFGEGGFGGGGVKQDDGPEPHEIITDLFGGGEDEQADEQIENNFEEMENDEMNEMVENLTGEDENIDMYGETEIDNYNDMYGDLGTDHDVYGEDFNTFLGDIDTGTTEGVGDNDGGGWVGLGNDGDGGGCGGCGGGGGFGGDLGGGGGDSGGGGGIFGGGFSGGAFGDSGGDGGGDGGATGGGGGWLDGFSGMDSGGGDGGGGGWGDGGGGVDGGGGGGGDGGGGGCGGGCGG